VVWLLRYSLYSRHLAELVHRRATVLCRISAHYCLIEVIHPATFYPVSSSLENQPVTPLIRPTSSSCISPLFAQVGVRLVSNISRGNPAQSWRERGSQRATFEALENKLTVLFPKKLSYMGSGVYKRT
jgi:hypothetical protein